MSSIIIALIVVSAVLVITFLLVSINNRQRRKEANELVAQFQLEGKENDLLISKWEMAGKLVIGLEAGKKKLLVFHKHLAQHRSYLVDLSKVKNCLKKKVYNKVNGGGSNEAQVEQISLQFEFIDGRPPVLICFYHPVNNHLFEMAEMEQKATDWEQLVRNIIHPN